MIHVVIARYFEDLSWLNDLEEQELLTNAEKIFVYTKAPIQVLSKQVFSPMLQSKMIIEPLPNVGREGHTYLYHICKYWDKLPMTTVFLHGSAATSYKWEKTIEVLQKVHKNKKESAFPILIYPPTQELNDFVIAEYSPSCHANALMNPEKKLHPSSIRPFGNWYRHHFPNKKEIPRTIFYNGIFAATNTSIKKNSLETYQNIMSELSESSSPEVGHYLERAWYGMFCD